MARPAIHKSITADRVVAACMRYLHSLDNPGICLYCGEDAEGVEPDASMYACDYCNMPTVYGAQQLIITGYYHPDPEPTNGNK